MDDLRIPIGIFFLIVGGILIFAPRVHAPLTTAPVNFDAGLAMAVFGAVMLWLALRRKKPGDSSQ